MSKAQPTPSSNGNHQLSRDTVQLPAVLKWTENLLIENEIRFDPSACGPGLHISEGNTHLRQTSPANAGYTCRVANAGWSQGVHYWSIRINDRGPNGYIMLGIVRENFDASQTQFPGSTSDGYGYYLNTGNRYRGWTATAFCPTLPRNGDVIGILLDLKACTLSYFNNGEILGCAFGQIPVQPDVTKYYPAVGFCELGQWVSLIKTSS